MDEKMISPVSGRTRQIKDSATGKSCHYEFDFDSTRLRYSFNFYNEDTLKYETYPLSHPIVQKAFKINALNIKKVTKDAYKAFTTDAALEKHGDKKIACVRDFNSNPCLDPAEYISVNIEADIFGKVRQVPEACKDKNKKHRRLDRYGRD